MTRIIIAGLDGSPESLAAADWAAREALRQGLPLRLIHAGTWERAGYTAHVPRADPDPRRDQEERIPRDARAGLHRRYPDLHVEADQISQQPATALLSAAEEGGLLVLGSRRLSPVAGFLVGSVAHTVVANAVRPVVLVRAGQAEADEHLPDLTGSRSTRSRYRDVVLGLDLARPDETVLRFAFEAAAGRVAPLRVVHGWNPPASVGYSALAMAPELTDEVKAEEDDALATALSPWREKYPDVAVVAEAVIGPPAHHLVEAAANASLVVVGRRMRDAGTGPFLGPVTHALMHRSAAAVAVVPHD
ncbi:universal stress protein [Streptomyces sp. NBC_01476]|uniref:universal stress protein n=1 Tax=Streptomyces sp. NBC_01476 TaxID=2903881 RepID=UPI002E31476B|nr:universal stress protein [Streptomyces sp. NBC_01476]